MSGAGFYHTLERTFKALESEFDTTIVVNKHRPAVLPNSSILDRQAVNPDGTAKFLLLTAFFQSCSCSNTYISY